MPSPGPIPTKEPTSRKTNMRSLVRVLGGPEQPYPVYSFGGRPRYEKANHNPFDGL